MNLRGHISSRPIFSACSRSCASIASVLAYRFRSGTVLELETVALRHQLNAPRRPSFRRPQLSSIDGLLWVRFVRTVFTEEPDSFVVSLLLGISGLKVGKLLPGA